MGDLITVFIKCNWDQGKGKTIFPFLAFLKVKCRKPYPKPLELILRVIFPRVSLIRSNKKWQAVNSANHNSGYEFKKISQY